jgi:IS4 transposase
MDKNTVFSSFGKWISPIEILKLQQKVDELKQDKYVKKLTTAAYIQLFLHAHLQQRDGLRAIADDVLQEDFKRQLGIDSISAAQLSRKHNQVNPEILAGVFFDLVSQIQMRHSTRKWQNIKVIDSSTISLCMKKYKWATFRKTKAGVKLHLRLAFIDEHNVYPEKAILTPARSNDRTQMDALIEEKDVTYVFDRGYVDYEKWDTYCDQGIFFTSRLKQNAIFREIDRFTVPEESPILSDSMVVIGTPMKRMANVLRLIETVDSMGNPIRIITNRFDLKSEEIGEMYRSRWAIELFFKWIKQHVKIKKFYGTTERAVENQIYLALIAYCLLVLVHMETKTKHSLTQISRWLKSFLWKHPSNWMNQIFHKPKRTSRGRQKKM